MNKELLGKMIAQATTIEEHYPAGCNGHPEHWCYFNKEKFAELIIMECAITAYKCFENGDQIACFLMDTFGVDYD